MSIESSPSVPPDEAITCKDSVRLVSLHRDSDITAQQFAGLSLHLARCARCQIAHKQFQSLFQALDALLANA